MQKQGQRALEDKRFCCVSGRNRKLEIMLDVSCICAFGDSNSCSPCRRNKSSDLTQLCEWMCTSSFHAIYCSLALV